MPSSNAQLPSPPPTRRKPTNASRIGLETPSAALSPSNKRSSRSARPSVPFHSDRGAEDIFSRPQGGIEHRTQLASPPATPTPSASRRKSPSIPHPHNIEEDESTFFSSSSTIEQTTFHPFDPSTLVGTLLDMNRCGEDRAGSEGFAPGVTLHSYQHEDLLRMLSQERHDNFRGGINGLDMGYVFPLKLNPVY